MPLANQPPTQRQPHPAFDRPTEQLALAAEFARMCEVGGASIPQSKVMRTNGSPNNLFVRITPTLRIVRTSTAGTWFERPRFDQLLLGGGRGRAPVIATNVRAEFRLANRRLRGSDHRSRRRPRGDPLDRPLDLARRPIITVAELGVMRKAAGEP
jgi:hypothetical protein